MEYDRRREDEEERLALEKQKAKAKAKRDATLWLLGGLVGMLLIFGGLFVGLRFTQPERYNHNLTGGLGDYDYQRVYRAANEHFYTITISPTQFGYSNARRSATAAAADLAVRLGYNRAVIMKTKKSSGNAPPSIEVQVYLFTSVKGQKPPQKGRLVDAHEALQREKYLMFLTDVP